MEYFTFSSSTGSSLGVVRKLSAIVEAVYHEE
jgi:hypothetical protein